MSNSIMSKLAAYRQASSPVIKQVPMSDEQATALRAKISKENRVNVHANRKDIAVPYRVQMVVRGVYQKPQGYFKNIETASLVGTLVAIARFGDSATVGHFDEEVALKDEEFHTWLNRDINADVKAKTAELFDNELF